MSLLGPLKKSFKRHGAYLFGLPSADLHAGCAIDQRQMLLQDLLEVDDLWPAGAGHAGKVDAHFLLDETSYMVAGGGKVGAGVPQIGSVKMLVRHSRQVHVEIRGVKLQRVEHDGDIVHVMDWLNQLNAHREVFEVAALLRLMRERKLGRPEPRRVDLVEAAVYVDELIFTTASAGEVDVEARVEAALPVDANAGFDVTWDRSGSLTWHASEVPIGFLPVRYAWAPGSNAFVLAEM